MDTTRAATPPSSPRCPLASLAFVPSSPASLAPENLPTRCPLHAHTTPAPEIPADTEWDIVTLRGTHQATTQSAALLRDIGGPDRLREACTRFYARAFVDTNTQPFFFEADGAEAHGKRLADWIAEKMDSANPVWTESGRLGMRQPSHFKAWNNSARASEVRGDHFNLRDTRTWMRLHFWACREVFLHQHEPFWAWYKQFIAHFIAVYERRAPPFTEADAEWSASQANLDAYEAAGRIMTDL